MTIKKTLVDAVSVKVIKIIWNILIVAVVFGLLHFIVIFIFPNLLGGLWIDQLILPFIFLGCIISGLLSWLTIKDSSIGRVFYAIITVILAIIPLSITIALPITYAFFANL